MNKIKMIILFVSLVIVLITVIGIIYVYGYINNILIPSRCNIGKSCKFIITANDTQNAILVFTTNMELLNSQNNLSGKVHIISSSGEKLSFDISKVTLKPGNWIYSPKTGKNPAKEYLLCGDLIFSELLRRGEILLVSIDINKLYDGDIWLFYLRKRKDKQTGLVKYIRLDKNGGAGIVEK